MSLTEMKLECNSKIRIDFGGGNLSSDGGLLLMKEFLSKIGFERLVAAKFKTSDDAKRFHSDVDNLMQVMYQIPSLIIQPIVENAFQHGVRDLEKGGLVSLRYEVGPSSFSVIVADNSGKMDDEKVRDLWNRVTDPESPDSSALCNLYRRLTLSENAGNELRLKCVDGSLTAVLIFRKRGAFLADAADRG